jgi:hypothetical protein
VYVPPFGAYVGEADVGITTTVNTVLVEIALSWYPAAFANARTLFVYGCVSVIIPPLVTDAEFVAGAVPFVV